jgi:hypothetical protein
MGCRESMELLQRKDACITVSTDLDDATRRWHLQDQVPVVGYDHELVQGQPVHDGIKGEVDLHNVEEDALHAVVLKRPKGDRVGNATVRHNEPWAHYRESA